MAINCDEIANIVALKILTWNDDIAKELADLSLSKREYRQIINQFEWVKNLDKEIEWLSTHHLKLLESSTEIKIRAIVQASILEWEKWIWAFDELAKQIRLTKSSLWWWISLLEKINKIDIYNIEEIWRLLWNKNTQKAISDLKKNVANFVSANYSISRYSEFKNDFVWQLKKQLEDKEITQRQYDEQIEKAHDVAMENIRTGKWTKSEANQELKKAEQQAKEKILKWKLTPEQAKKELDKAKKEAEKKIKKWEPPIWYAKIDEEWQYISKIAKWDEKAAMDMWTQYVMARELIADWWLDDEVLQIFKDNRVKNLAWKLTLNQISKYWEWDLPILIARAYLNTKQLYEDWVLREAFRTKLIQLTSWIEMTTEDIDRVKRLIRLQNFASQWETFTDILRNNNIYETAKSLWLDLKWKTWEWLYNWLRDFCKKIATDWIPDWPIVINGIEMQANDVIQIIFSLTWDNNIIKLYRSWKFDDNTVLSIATQYLFWDKKWAENSILSLFQRARQMPKSDDKRGLILKTITGTNVTSDKKIWFYDFRAWMYDQDINTRAKADFMNKLADRNKMRLPSDWIEVIQTTESVEELVNILENYRWWYIMVNDAQYNVNPTLRAALNKINYEKWKIVSDDRRVEVIFPRRWMDWNFTVDNNWVVYFRTRDSDWFDELSWTISIQSLWDSNPTREVLASEYELKTWKNWDAIRYQATYNNKVVNNKWTQISDQQDVFFKLSKVRDANWNLLVVYHWSKEEFDIFDFNRIDKAEYWPWFYFTDDETYALHHWGWIVMETYVNITNPLEYDINAFRSNITQDQMEQIFQRLYNKWIFDDDDFDEFWDRIADAWSTNWDRAFTTFLDIHYAAKNKWQWKDFFDTVIDITGYDWIVSHAREWQTFYIAFDQSQIKVIDNLEPTLNPSIRYQAQPSLFWQKSTYWTIDDVTEEIAADEALKVKLFKSDRTIKDIADQYWLPINIVKSIVTPEWLKAYWSYWNWIINIAEIAKSSTAPHELFHAVFDLVDKKEKNNIIEQAKKLFWDDVDVDEMLANKFSQYFRTWDFDFDTSKKVYKSLKEKIAWFFEKIKEWITWVDQYKTQVKSMFDNIINCEYLPNAWKNVNELTALTKYDNEINDLAIKYYWEMLWVTLWKKVDKMYIDRVQSLLSEITWIDIKAFTEIKDKAKLRDMVDSRFTLDKMYWWQYTTEITDIREVADRISKMSNDDLVLEIKDTFWESVDNLEITNENIDAIRESYLDFMTAPTEVDYLTSKWRIISLANWWDAQTLSLDEIRAAFQTNSFEDKYSMFLNWVSDENKKKIIDSINDDVFDTLTISFSENLVKAWYSLPLISCRSLLYDYLKWTLDVNNQFVKAFFTKNDIPVTVDNLNTLLNNSLPKNLKFDYESWLYKWRLNQPNAWEIAVFKKLDNRFLPDSYSALAAIESSQIPSISWWWERKRLKAILDEYVKACKEWLEKNMTFREAQELKQLASYALDALEQDDILPKFWNIFTYQERQWLLWMKYSLPIVIWTQDHAAAITNLEGIVESILDKYDQLLKNAALKNDINISIINNVKWADKKAEKQISERTKQLAEQWATIKEINWEYIVYDVRQAIVDALNPDNMSATIWWLDWLKWIQLRQLETLSNKQAYSLLRYIEAAKALDWQSNLFRTIMYKQSPQLWKVDFFRTFKLDQQSWLPRALLSDRLSQFTIFKDMDNTAPMDITIKKQIFNDIKNTFKKNWYITTEELDWFVVKAVDDNIWMLWTTINPKQIKEFADTMVKAYNDAFIPYSYLRDLPKWWTLSDWSKLANIHDIVDNFVRWEYSKAIKDVKEFWDNSFDELLNKIYITTVDWDTRLLKDYSNMWIDAWKESIFWKEFKWVEIMSDEDIKKAEIWWKYKWKLDSKRYLRELDEERENIVNQYNSNISAILNDIQIVTQADRDIMGALFPTVRQLMRKYTLTQKIADATDRVSGVNEEVARWIKSYLLWFQWQINFSHWWEDDIKKRLKEVQNAYREYYKLSLDRLSTISGPSTPAEWLALNIAKYFKALEDSLGSIDWLAWCTTKAEINRAFYNIWEVFLNIESVPWIYWILSAIEQSQILKYFRYSKPWQASYVKQFDLKRWEKFISERLWQYREFVQDISWISWHEFNDIFGTAFDEWDYKKVVQWLSWLTLSWGSRAILQRLSNILNWSSFLGRLLITYPFQLLTIPQQWIWYFLKMLWQEARLEISSLNEIDAARMKYWKILDWAFNELPSLRYINPDNLSPNAYYNRYWIPDIDDMYRRVDWLQMTDTPEIIEAKTKSILAKTNDWISIFQRWADPYKDNANNIVDWVFARNFKNIAFFKALKENEIMPFGSIKQFSEFMDNPNINPAIKKQLMTRVEELSWRNFRNMLAIGFWWLDRAVWWNRWTNIFYWIMQMFNFRWAWWWNVVKQTNEFITTAFKTILKNPFSKDTQDEFIEYITKQPEWLNFTTAVVNDLKWSRKLARFTDNGDRPDEESEYWIMDFIEYITKSMDMTSQWYQWLQSFGPLRPFQDWIESMRQSLDDPDVYKDKYWVWAFLNSLVSNFGRQWKPRNWIVKMLNAWISWWAENMRAYVENEFWKASWWTLRYMIWEQEWAYWYTYDFSILPWVWIPPIIMGTTYTASDRQFMYDLDSTATWEELKEAFNPDNLNADRITYTWEVLKWMINGSQLVSFLKNAKNLIHDINTRLKWDTDFKNNKYYYTMNDFSQLALKSDAWQEFYRYWYVTPTTTLEARAFFDMVLNHWKYRPGSESFNKSVVQYEETWHMDGSKTGKAADKEMEIWLDDMKYDDNWNVNPEWKTFIETVNNNFYDKTATKNYIYETFYNWMWDNSDNPNYNLYLKLLWQWNLNNYIEQRIDEEVKKANIWRWKKADQKWDETEWKNVNYNKLLLEIWESEFKWEWKTVFQEAQLLDKDTATQYALVAIADELQWEDKKELEKFFTVTEDEDWVASIKFNYQYKERLEQFASMARYLEEKNIEWFLAEASSIADPYLDKDPTWIVTAELMDSINNRVQSAEWLSAEEKNEIMVALFHHNREYIEQAPEKLKELLWDDYDRYARAMNEMLHDWDMDTLNNLEQMQMNWEWWWEWWWISKAIKLSSALKSMRLPTSGWSWTTWTSRTRIRSWKFVPTQIKGSELIRDLWLSWYAPKDVKKIALQWYNPSVSFKINKDTTRNKPTRKSTQAISTSKQLSKLEDKTIKAITAES